MRQQIVRSVPLLVSATWLFQAQGAGADVNNNSGSKAPLQGGVKQDAGLHSSLTVVRGGKSAPSGNKPLSGNLKQFSSGASHFSSGVSQFSGSVQTSFGPTSPVLQGQVNGFTQPLSASKGVSSWLPGYGTSAASQSQSYAPTASQTPGNGIINWVPGYSAMLMPRTPTPDSNPGSSTHNGITDWQPGYSTSAVNTPAATSDSPHSLGNGIVVWSTGLGPGGWATAAFSSTQTTANLPTTPRNGVVNWQPGYSVSVSSSSSTPGSTATATSRDGVVVWIPGHATGSVIPPTLTNGPLVASGLRGVLVSPSLSGALTALKAQAKLLPKLPGENASAVPLPSETAAPVAVDTPNVSPAALPVPLVATAKLLPGLKAVKAEPVLRATSWEDWFQRVAKAIYSRWSDADVGPGVASIRVTVYSNHYLECQVVDFTQAQDVDRNAVQETLFRETAKQDISDLNGSAVLAFPIFASQAQVIFDVDMKRAVDGPANIQVITAHD